jgi:hypothetical protein
MIYRDPGIPAVIPRAGEIIDFGPCAKVQQFLLFGEIYSIWEQRGSVSQNR